MDLSGFLETLQEVEAVSKKVCAVCQEPAEKSCSACHGVYYCSVEHQKSNWKEHKKDCPPIRIATSPELGPHFVATRDLLPGSLLHTELPVLASPFVITKDTPPPSCISCRSILHRSSPWPCFQCSAPYFCNLACSMNKIHSEFECGILSKCNEEQRKKLATPPNIYLGYLRAINLKNKDPQTWAKVLKLRGADQYKPGDADENDKWFIREILPLIGEKGIGFEADMAKLRGILQQRGIVDNRNGINVPKVDHCESQLLYLEASNFAQNCFPNCTPIIGKGPQFQLQVRTTVGVKKGEITSIDYDGCNYAFGAMVQKHKMHLIGGALCICPRCSDPTELGTMLSAVKCMEPNCKKGYLLPVDPMDMAKNAPWRCNHPDCKGSSTCGEIEIFPKGLYIEVQTILKTVPLKDLPRHWNFIITLEKKLHPNHWLVLFFKTGTIDKIRAEKGLKMLTTGIQMYIEIIDELFKIFELIAPGLSMAKARLWDNLLDFIMTRLNAFDLIIGFDMSHQETVMEFKRRAIEAIDQFCSIAKFYPVIWPKEYIAYKKGLKPDIQRIQSYF